MPIESLPAGQDQGDTAATRLSFARLNEQMKSAFSGERAACLLGQFGASIVLIIAITVLPSTTANWDYTVSVGAVGSFFALVGLVLQKTEIGETRTLFTVPIVGEVNLSGLNALTMFVWWAVAAWVITIQDPFTTTGNGYFATWIGFGCSLAGVGVTLPHLKARFTASSNSLLGLVIASIVVGAELLLRDSSLFTPVAQSALGLSTAVITGLSAFTVYITDLKGEPVGEGARSALFLGLGILWAISAYWLTFTHPFSATGNGYFGLWVGMFILIKLTVSSNTIETARTTVSTASDRAISMLGQLVASIVLTIAVSFLEQIPKIHYHGYWQYALVVGIVGIVFSFIGGILLRSPDYDKKVGTKSSYSHALSVFLFVWWAVGAGIITINGPFVSTASGLGITANGFFAAWAGFGFSIFGIGVTVAQAKAAAASNFATLSGLFVCSIVDLIEFSKFIGDQAVMLTNGISVVLYTEYKTQIIFGLVISVVTTFVLSFVLLARFKDKAVPDTLMKLLTVSFFILWTIMASWITFTGPFGQLTSGSGHVISYTTNGYFASWGGVAFSTVLALASCFPDMFKPRTAPLANEEAGRDGEDGGQVFVNSVVDNVEVVVEDRTYEDRADASPGKTEVYAPSLVEGAASAPADQ